MASLSNDARQFINAVTNQRATNKCKLVVRHIDGNFSVHLKLIPTGKSQVFLFFNNTIAIRNHGTLI